MSFLSLKKILQSQDDQALLKSLAATHGSDSDAVSDAHTYDGMVKGSPKLGSKKKSQEVKAKKTGITMGEGIAGSKGGF